MNAASETIVLLVQHELAIKSLYEAFAEAFPHYRTLWMEIAHEEQGHADLLLSAHEHDGDSARAAFTQVRPQAVMSSIAFVEEKIALVKKGGLSIVQALSLARELEQALLESSALKAMKTAPACMLPVLLTLTAETRRHQEIVEAALAVELAK